jgi:hypothetical protein
MVLAVAVLLIIGGANIGSAVHANPSPSTVGFTMPSSASPSSMPTAVRTQWAVIPLVPNLIGRSRATGDHAGSVDEEVA